MKRKVKKIVLHSEVQKAMNARRTGGGVHHDKRRSQKAEQKLRKLAGDLWPIFADVVVEFAEACEESGIDPEEFEKEDE